MITVSREKFFLFNKYVKKAFGSSERTFGLFSQEGAKTAMLCVLR
jgi:hypothetical protein